MGDGIVDLGPEPREVSVTPFWIGAGVDVVATEARVPEEELLR